MHAACTAIAPLAQGSQTAAPSLCSIPAAQGSTASASITAPASIPDQADLPFEADPRLSILRDVVYGTDDLELQTLDAYLVVGEQPSPVVVEIHGGGWRRGSKSQFELYPDGLIALLIERGISVVSVNYRLTPGDIYPAQVQDVQRAIQFVRLHAEEWHIDPQHIAAMGGSAGAHLSAWIALHEELADSNNPDPLAQQSTRLSCFVDMWGPMDLSRVNLAELAQTELRGADFASAYANFFGTIPDLYNRTAEMQLMIRDASPLYHVSGDDPPAMIVHNAPAELSGVDHPPVPATINDPHSPWFGVLLAEAMQAAGIEVVRYTGPAVGEDPDTDAEAIAAFLQKCLFEGFASP